MRVERATRCLSGLRRPLRLGVPPLALSREGRGGDIVLATAFAPSPLKGEGWDEGGAGNSVIKRLRRPPPHPGPLPQGERELHCACRAPAAFAPSPLTGEGWDEGGAGNSVRKRPPRPPPPSPSP